MASKRLMSVVSTVTRNSMSLDDDKGPQIDARPQALETKPEIVNRNKRLFGALMGHLGKAKQILEHDKSKIEQQTNQKISASEKNIQALKIATEKQQELKNMQKEQMAMTDSIKTLERRMREIDHKANDWQASLLKAQTMIETKAMPAVLWVPNRHNAFTKTLVEERKQQITSVIEDRRVRDKVLVDSIKSEIESKKSELRRTEQLIAEHTNNNITTPLFASSGTGHHPGGRGLTTRAAARLENNSRRVNDDELEEGECGGDRQEEEDDGQRRGKKVKRNDDVISSVIMTSEEVIVDATLDAVEGEDLLAALDQ